MKYHRKYKSEHKRHQAAMHTRHNGYVSVNLLLTINDYLTHLSITLSINQYFGDFVFPTLRRYLLLPSFSDDTRSQSQREEGPSGLSLQVTTAQISPDL